MCQGDKEGVWVGGKAEQKRVGKEEKEWEGCGLGMLEKEEREGMGMM